MVVVSTGGCVTRRMTVRSNVPGAQVYVDNYEIGRTPASTDFTYYGTRNIRLVKDGFETLTVQQPIHPPWYQWPGLDFVFENVWPWEIRDERQLAFEMKPQYVVPTEQLLSRAEELRASTVQPAAATSSIASPYAVPGAVQPGVVVPGTVVAPPGVTSPFNTAPPAVSPYGPQVTPQPGIPSAPASALPGYSSQPGPYAMPGATMTVPAAPYYSPYTDRAAPAPPYGGTPVPQLP